MSAANKTDTMSSELMYSKILYSVATAPLFGGIHFALEHCLKIILSELDYEIGHWFWEENQSDGLFKSGKHWRTKDNNKLYKDFQIESDSLVFSPSEGFYDDISLSTPLCIETIKHNKFKRGDIPSAAVFHSALFIPIHLNKNFYGFIEFYSTRSVKATQSLRRFAELIGIELNRQIDYIHSQEVEKQQIFQLAQASRLSSLGAMAGGIAHEINNPLTIIMGTLKIAIRALETGDPDSDKTKLITSLERARSHTERISKIVKGIRALSRDGASDPFVNAKISDILEDTLNLCEARIQTNNIQLSYEIENDDLAFQCRPVQISQVLLNLINNSIDAVGELPNPWISLSAVRSGTNIEFKLTDSGPGIPENIANQLMQPFFTTKGTGRGTGLGLSISQEIVIAHLGKFFLNREFKNTQFVVIFPIEHNSEQ